MSCILLDLTFDKLKTGDFVTKKHLYSFTMGMVLENWLLRSPHKASKLLRIAYKASIVATIYHCVFLVATHLKSNVKCE